MVYKLFRLVPGSLDLCGHGALRCITQAQDCASVLYEVDIHMIIALNC
jgi:hypothetical protein